MNDHNDEGCLNIVGGGLFALMIVVLVGFFAFNAGRQVNKSAIQLRDEMAMMAPDIETYRAWLKEQEGE